MAAKTSSVSYKGELSADMLQKTLALVCAPTGFEPNIRHLLNEAPVELVVMAIEETAQREAVAPATIWLQVAKLAKDLGSVRQQLWA